MPKVTSEQYRVAEAQAAWKAALAIVLPGPVNVPLQDQGVAAAMGRGHERHQGARPSASRSSAFVIRVRPRMFLAAARSRSICRASPFKV